MAQQNTKLNPLNWSIIVQLQISTSGVRLYVKTHFSIKPIKLEQNSNLC